MNNKQAINILVQVSKMAQKAGLLSLDDAVQVAQAIKVASASVDDQPESMVPSDYHDPLSTDEPTADEPAPTN